MPAQCHRRVTGCRFGSETQFVIVATSRYTAGDVPPSAIAATATWPPLPRKLGAAAVLFTQMGQIADQPVGQVDGTAADPA